jgi:hypothetical protein
MKVVDSHAFAPREYREDTTIRDGDAQQSGGHGGVIGTASGSGAGGVFLTEDKPHGIIGTGGGDP